MLIPHIYRQEVYAGQLNNSKYYEHDEFDVQRSMNPEIVNTSPVDFFQPYLKKFPHFKDIGL